jgi:hypothetical protein
MTRGKAICRAAVVHPVESYWLKWGDKENTAQIRQAMDERFLSLCDWLLRGLIDFDYICESTLPPQCRFDEITDGILPVGEGRYSAVIVPALDTVRISTLTRLECFQARGGNLIILGHLPKYIDAVPHESTLDPSRLIPFERLAVLNALEDYRELEIRTSDGSISNGYLYQLRQDGAARWLFIARADNPANKDLPKADELTIKIKGIWSVELFDTSNGDVIPLNTTHGSNKTIIKYKLYEHDSLLIRLKGCEAADSPLSEGSTHSVRSGHRTVQSPVKINLREPNTLLLDMPEYALNGEHFRPREEILKLGNILRRELGFNPRGNHIAQPWVENDFSTPHTVRLRYTFNSETVIENAKLALEEADSAIITLNGEKAMKIDGWYVDKCIKTVGLPQIIKGENTLTSEIPYGRKTNLEAMYLLGDFGVLVAGTACTLTPPVTTLAFGDITRQGLPFYGGNIGYHFTAASKGGFIEIEATHYRGQIIGVKIDGTQKGSIIYSPYRLRVDGLADGEHDIELILYGNRINTFGQLHNVSRNEGYWWGPNSWRTTGAEWSYEYKFWEQGILKAPAVYTGSRG